MRKEESVLFPSYLCLSFNINKIHTSTISSNPGAHGFVRFGAEPCMVPDEVISAIECARLIALDADLNIIECHNVNPADTALDVAKTESGFNPFAIAEIIPKKERKLGDKGIVSYLPTNKGGALNIVRRIESKNRRYSVGLMQIASTNFSKFNVTAESLFYPCTNLSVFKKSLPTAINVASSLKMVAVLKTCNIILLGFMPNHVFHEVVCQVDIMNYGVLSFLRLIISNSTNPAKYQQHRYYPLCDSEPRMRSEVVSDRLRD